MQRGIGGIVEDDEIAAADKIHRRESREAAGRDLFVDQQKVADQQRGFHRRRGNAKGLRSERHNKQRDHQDIEQRLEAMKQAVMVVNCGFRRFMRETHRAAFDCAVSTAGAGAAFAFDLSLDCAFGLSLDCAAESRLAKARRAASYWACFLVLPSALARVSGAPSAPATRTSMRKRFWWSGPDCAARMYCGWPWP